VRRNIYLNGRFIGGRLTGVGRAARELTERLLRLLAESDRLSGSILAPGVHPATTLAAIAPHRNQSLAAGVLWEQILLPFLARDGYLVSFSNTAPLALRRQLVVVHDASVFAMPENYSVAFRTWYQVALRILLRRAGTVVTVSAFSRDELSRHCGVPAERISVIHNGCDHLDGVVADPAILDRAGLARDEYVLTVGTPSRVKNLGVLIEAMVQLRRGGLKLALAGAMESRVFNVNSLDIPPWVKVLGAVSDGELKALYERALCFAFPSRYEGFGIPPLEAMRCGCPTVVSSAASLPEICGDAALYAHPEDTDALARHIGAYLDSGELRQTYRARGQAQAGRFLWDSSARKLLALIEHAVRV
jgi:glycosyltransferase involved in cell wall biosynthesis